MKGGEERPQTERGIEERKKEKGEDMRKGATTVRWADVYK
jgi:hypothetical protein